MRIFSVSYFGSNGKVFDFKPLFYGSQIFVILTLLLLCRLILALHTDTGELHTNKNNSGKGCTSNLLVTKKKVER